MILIRVKQHSRERTVRLPQKRRLQLNIRPTQMECSLKPAKNEVNWKCPFSLMLLSWYPPCVHNHAASLEIISEH